MNAVNPTQASPRKYTALAPAVLVDEGWDSAAAKLLFLLLSHGTARANTSVRPVTAGSIPIQIGKTYLLVLRPFMSCGGQTPKSKKTNEGTSQSERASGIEAIAAHVRIRMDFKIQ